MEDVPRIYHMRPTRIAGKRLLPLNVLCARYPELSKQVMAKYKGREAVPKRPLPELGCTWADCVMFATVHPSKIRDSIVRAGHTWPERGIRFLGIRADNAAFSARNTVIWLYSDTGRADFATPKADVVPFTVERVAELKDLQSGTQSYLREMKQAGRRPLLFVGVPHVLHRGEIPRDLCEEIVV